MYDFQRVDSRQDAARELAAYNKLLTKYDALNFAADEGVFKVTIHSESGTIDVPVSFGDGRGIVTTLLELHAAWVKQVEGYLNFSLVSVGQETESEQNAMWLRQEQRAEAMEAQRKQSLAEIDRINRITAAALQQEATRSLAQQAATTIPQQPATRKVGRPKKEVAAELGQAAAAVPMNGTGKQPGSVVAQPQG